MTSFWHKLPKPFFALAPLADVTDAAFRRIIAKYGRPDVMWTEFVSADGLFRGEHPTDPEKGAGYDVLIKDLMYTEAERPIVAQFFSKEPELMKRSAELAVELGYDGVDINMGCPDKNVCKQGAGAAMIKTSELAQEIIRATQEGARWAEPAGWRRKQIPVSVKTRIGYNTNEIETWIPALLEAEPAVISLHARTRKEMSKVPADWGQIKRAVELRDELQKGRAEEEKTLIVGNGDVMSLEEGRQRAEESGCDGVMLGRAIFGNPWLFANLTHAERGSQTEHPAPKAFGAGDLDIQRPPLNERLKILLEHIELFDELFACPSEPAKNREGCKSFYVMKKHFKSYIKGEDGSKELTLKLMDAKDKEEVQSIIQDALQS